MQSTNNNIFKDAPSGRYQNFNNFIYNSDCVGNIKNIITNSLKMLKDQGHGSLLHISGPSFSGKTTLINACITELDSIGVKYYLTDAEKLKFKIIANIKHKLATDEDAVESIIPPDCKVVFVEHIELAYLHMQEEIGRHLNNVIESGGHVVLSSGVLVSKIFDFHKNFMSSCNYLFQISLKPLDFLGRYQFLLTYFANENLQIDPSVAVYLAASFNSTAKLIGVLKRLNFETDNKINTISLENIESFVSEIEELRSEVLRLRRDSVTLQTLILEDIQRKGEKD